MTKIQLINDILLSICAVVYLCKTLKLTFLLIINYCLLQFLFMRLVRVHRFYSEPEKTKTYYELRFGIVPLSGWKTDYKFIFFKKTIKIF